MDDIQVFGFENRETRAVLKDGEPWFVAKDVAEALGYVWNGTQRIEHVPEEWRGVTSVVTPSGNQSMAVLSEQGLYFFLARSDKPGALPFQKWIAGEVLPSIRKTGTYIATPKTYLEALEDLVKSEKEKQVLQIENSEMQPKAEFYDQVAGSNNAIQMRDVAAVLNIQGWGRNKIFALLRQMKVLDGRNVPYREYQDRGYFRVIEQGYADTEGETHINLKTLVYQTGVDFVRKIILRQCKEAA